MSKRSGSIAGHGVARPPDSIDVLIAGAAKAGTSSLLAAFSQHPAVWAQTRSEMMFFLDDAEYARGFEQAARRYFGVSDRTDRTTVAKLAGLMHYPAAVERLKATAPDARVIVVLRNPVDRAFSAYWYARRIGREDLSFEEAIRVGPARHSHLLDPGLCDYLGRGRYAPQLTTLFDTFSRDRVRVFRFEDLRRDAKGMFADVCRSIGLSPTVESSAPTHENRAAVPRSASIAKALSYQGLPKELLRKVVPSIWLLSVRNKIQSANEREVALPPMDEGLRAELSDYFRSSNEELEALLGWDLSEWMSG